MRSILRHSAVLCLAMVACAVPLAAQDASARIDSVLRAYADGGRFNGTALVASGGRVVYEGAFGLVDQDTRAPLTPATPMRIASVSKAFTALLVMQQVQEGRLRLDEPITTYLPRFRRDTGSRITLRHLLTHRSGLPHDQAGPSVAYRPEEGLDADLLAEPGSTFQYNNRDYYLLARVLERVTGRTFAELLQERVLRPAGMAATGVHPYPSLVPGEAVGYAPPDSTGLHRAPELDMRNYLGAAGMYSTAADLHRFDRALADGRLLSPALRDTMYAPGPGAAAFGSWVYARPFGGGRKQTLVDRRGALGGFGAWFLRLPDDDGVVILLDSHESPALQEIGERILAVLYGTPPAAPGS
ncbi:MAG TPA: serine hydrolase domain-containing protein [Longimicrobium sp.]|nr:serine hydrolase domain-containing protein [Longimicrobium sp.]